MEEIYKQDRQRYNERGGYILRYLFFLRKAQGTNSSLIRIICRVILNHYKNKYGLEIPFNTQIGPGLYLGHAFNITINGGAVIGKNCNIHKGVVIGQTNRGKNKGAPHIGDYVWIGINSAIVGNIKIGDDVLIAPNSFVNCDIPSHSIVFGNPCLIKHKENATEGYINRIVD